jgi:hypothetical protein
MGQRDVIALLVELFEKYKISYILTGSFAGSYWGYPRATHDVDFLVEVESKGSERLISMLKGLGKDFEISFSQAENAIKTKWFFNIFHRETDLKIDFWVAKDSDFEKNKFNRKVYTKVFDRKIAIVSAEDLVLTKLRWIKEVYSERHFRDCVGILKRQKGNLDEKYLVKNAEKLGVAKLLLEARESKYF